MNMLIEIPEKHYDQLVAACPQKSAEYVLLKNGCITNDKKSGSKSRLIQILCDEKQTFMLRETASRCCPEAVQFFEKKG